MPAPTGFGGQGPMRHIKVRNQWVPRTNAEIQSAALTVEGQEDQELLSNRFSASVTNDPSTMYVYHSYYYLIDKDKCYGRWYHTEFPRQSFPPAGTRPYVFRATIEGYELNDSGSESGTVQVSITFTDKAARRLEAVLAAPPLAPPA